MYGYSRGSLVKNLEDLCSVPGVSGFEKQTGISDALYTLVKRMNPDTIQDQRGNVISIFGTGDTKIALDAHMDEVGFTIVDISTHQIELSLIGVYTLSQIAGSPVWIIGKDIP
jgi:putative aminopeptidase FrvX